MAHSQRAPATPPTAADRIGQRYRVLERLGQGGSAVVYRVQDVSSGREVALKQLSVANAKLRGQFDREYLVLAQLAHPSVIQVHDFGVDPAGPFYTMELLPAGDLGVRAPWPYAKACRVLMQVCSALSLLHARKLVHGDISPRNVRITASGTAKLIDFGAMTSFGRAEQAAGTPGFVAPEVVHRLPLDARTDVFSLGATLYYALTGRAPFAGRSLKELAEDWGGDPPAPSELGADVPPALDALVLSMLRTDPARRPGNAFEVMQRLAASAGVTLPESDEIARASLTLPLLVGRDAQLRRFRQLVRRTLHGSGGAVAIQGSSGLGRTRFLETCVIEAKLSGASVLRAAARAAGGAPWSSARQLVAQMFETLPELARSTAPDALSSPDATLASSGEDIGKLQLELQDWLLRVAQTQPLVIALDDLEHVDEASLALLVGLAHAARGARVLLTCTANVSPDVQARPALSLLLAQASTLPLTAWSAHETETLFASLFYGAPHVSLVSDRVQHIAQGHPREALALVQHMLDRTLIRFSDGSWCLPAELAVSDLPANAQDALHIQLESLPAMARRLAQAQALALDDRWTRESYQLLAHDAAVDDALTLLQRTGVVSSSAGTYTLSHPSVRAALLAPLTAAGKSELHAALSVMCERQAFHVLCHVHHLLQAGAVEPAMERLRPLLSGASARVMRITQSGLQPATVVQIFEDIHIHYAPRGRHREAHELSRLLLELSVVTDNQIFYRFAPSWLAQLERDSGLQDYRVSDPTLPPAKRLEQALLAASARYAGTPEAERVYRVDEAIKHLAFFVVIAIAIGSRTANPAFLVAIDSLLEPFSPLSPLLHALWQNALAVGEATSGRNEHAHRRWLDVYSTLAPMSERDLPYVTELRCAIAFGIAGNEITRGLVTAEHWIAAMEEDPLQRGAAQYLRRVLCIMDGDAAGAERHRKQAELYAAQAAVRDMFEMPHYLELHAHVQTGDLTGIKHVADRMGLLAARWPGWSLAHQCAQAAFHRLRGDLKAAEAALEQAMALAEPEQQQALIGGWKHAAIQYVQVLSELDRDAEAHAFAKQLLERFARLEISPNATLEHALAVVEAKLGDHASAVARIDRLLAQGEELRPAFLAQSFEARARIAILAKDAAAAGHYARLTTEKLAAVSSNASLAKRKRLLEEAEHAGIDLGIPLSEFEATVLQGRRPPAALPAHILESVAQQPSAEARALQVLTLLAAAANTRAGHLYYLRSAHMVRSATLAAQPDATLDQFAQRYIEQWRAQSAMTTVFTEIHGAADPVFARWTDRTGTVHAIGLLQRGSTCVGLIALCNVPAGRLTPEYRALCEGLVQQLLTLGDVQST